MVTIKLDNNHELIALGNQYTIYNVDNSPVRKTFLAYRSCKPFATLQDMLEDNPYGLNEDEIKLLSEVDTDIEKYITHENKRVRLLVAKTGLFGDKLKDDKSIGVRCIVAKIAETTQNNELLTHFVTDKCEQIRCIVASNINFSGIMMHDTSKRVRDKALITTYQGEVKWHLEQIKKCKEEIKQIYSDDITNIKGMSYITIDDVEYDLR